MLVTSNEEMLKGRLSRYEAVTPINSPNQVESIWKINKTPVILRANLSGKVDYPVLEVPDEVVDTTDTEVFVDFAHENGFESGEFITGQKYDTQNDDCFLCRIANREGSTKPLWIYNKDVQREANVIIYESEHFFVVSEYGSIMRGFLMICPKEHILSIAGIPDEYFEEYYQVERDVEFILRGTYGTQRRVSFFEHGSNPSGKSSHKRSVVHAHTHVIYGFELEKKYRDMVCMEPCDDIRKARGGKYFSYRNGADGQLMIVKDPAVYVQRQFPRQVMAEEIGLAPGQYNWRNEGFEENVTATLYRMHCFLMYNYSHIPERIRNNVDGFVKGYALREGYRKA